MRTEKKVFLGWIPVAFLAWAFIFGTYEIIERTLLKDVNPSVLFTLHIIRGTGTSFILAALVAWYFIKLSEKRKITAVEVPSFMKEFEITQAKELIQRSLWLIRLRWIAIAGVIIATLLSRYVIKILPDESVTPLFVIVSFMTLYNTFFLRTVKISAFPKAIAFSQIFLDLVSLTMLLHFSGSAENPFFAFFVFHVIISGILLEKGESYFVAAVACILFTLMVLFEYFGIVRHYSLGILPVKGLSYLLGLLTAFVATTFFSAYFVTSIMANLRKRELQIREAADLLAQEKSKLSDIVQSIGAGLVVVDKNFNIAWENEKIKEWSIYTDLRKDLTTKSKDANVIEGNVTSYEYKAPDQSRYFMITLSPIRDLSGKATHILGLIQDITKKKEMEIQLIQTGKMAAVGQLAAGIAHEINNPLATLAASTELLLEIAQNDTLKKLKEFEPFTRHLKRIDEHVFRCKDIVLSLLGFARKDDEEFILTSINSIVADSIKLLTGEAQRHNKAIQFEPGQLPDVKTHPKRLQQAFINIIMNGLDAIGEKGCVKIKTYHANGMINIEFADNGRGIPGEDLERIFDPFFTTKPVGKGTGLGLYLCHQIITAVKGKIDVESKVGKGSIFTVSLPV